MQIDANHEAFKNIAPLISRLNKKDNDDEDEEGPVRDVVRPSNEFDRFLFFQVEEDAEEERGDDDEEDQGRELFDDFFSSDEDTA